MYVVNGNILVDHFSCRLCRLDDSNTEKGKSYCNQITTTMPKNSFRLYATDSAVTAAAIILCAVCCMWCDLYFFLFYIISDKVEHNVSLRWQHSHANRIFRWLFLASPMLNIPYGVFGVFGVCVCVPRCISMYKSSFVCSTFIQCGSLSW